MDSAPSTSLPDPPPPADTDRSPKTGRRLIRLWKAERNGRRRLLAYGAAALLMWGFFEVSARVEHSGTVMIGVFLLSMLGLFVLDSLAMRNVRVWRRGKLPLFLRMKMWAIGGALICPFCREGLSDADADCCDGCGTGYHSACRAELLGSCGTLGCVNQGRRVQAPSKLKLKA